MLYYLDSSAWVKRYFNEVDCEAVTELFYDFELLGCSPLGLLEVGSTMVRKRKAGEVKPGEFMSKRDTLLKDWRHFLRMELTPGIVQRAFDMTDAHGLRGADSVHLASALVLKQELALAFEEFTFVTSDQELKAAALKAGLSVLDPQEKTIN